MNRKLQPEEIELVGGLLLVGERVIGDEINKRIQWLIENVLKEIAFSKLYGAWETLFLDPNDGRHWIRTYPQGEMHGGGPPALINISEEEAHKKYDFN